MRKGEELKTLCYASATALCNDRLPHSQQLATKLNYIIDTLNDYDFNLEALYNSKELSNII